MTIAKRFAEKHSKSSGCWNWIAAKNGDGYGKFWLNGKNVHAHRVAFELQNGEIPEGMHVLHRCDNPACVNPEHLFTGTHKENMLDMVKKGRRHKLSNFGIENGMSKLTDTQVDAIKSDSRRVGKIALDFGISHQHVSKIKLGQRRRVESSVRC